MGKITTPSKIRNHLAQTYNTAITCPLTTGIFIRIAAEAAEEDRSNHKNSITPYWRVIKEDGKLNEKYPRGIEKQATFLQEEGIQLTKKGSFLKVTEPDKYLFVY